MHKYAIASLFIFSLMSQGCITSMGEPGTGTEQESVAQLDTQQRADLDAFVDASKGIALPLRSSQSARIGNFSSTTTEVFAIDNFLAVPIFAFNSFTLQGTPSVALPSSIPAFTEQVFGVNVPAAQSWSQVMSYTTNLSSPVGNSKACSWVVSVTFNGSCTGNASAAPLGLQGAVCGIDSSRSFIDPATCQTQVVWTIQ